MYEHISLPPTTTFDDSFDLQTSFFLNYLLAGSHEIKDYILQDQFVLCKSESEKSEFDWAQPDTR